MVTRFAVLACLILPSNFCVAQTRGNSAGDAAYAKAVDLINSGHLSEGRDALGALLRADPGYFTAYGTYWDAVARTRDSESRRLEVVKSVQFFETVPVAERTEDYYLAYEDGLRVLGETSRLKSVHSECVGRYPRGLEAQQDISQRAETEKNPVKSVAMFRDYMRRFPENVAWTEGAAHSIFMSVLSHPTLFEPVELSRAAEDWDRHEDAFVKTFGNPMRYLVCTRTIAEALVSSIPASAAAYCEKGEAFVEREWTATTEFDESARRDFWPILLDADVAMKKWSEAARLGRAIETLMDTHRMLSSPADIQRQASLRVAYARALEGAGDIPAAGRQFGVAAALVPAERAALDGYLARHPVSEASLEQLRRDWEVAAADVRRGNEAAAKAAVLASEDRSPRTAPELGLRDLGGHPVSLAHFRGRPLIVAFWATWCGPCRFELKELNRFFDEEGGAPSILAVSVDREKEAVGPFAAKQGYRFAIAISDGSGESFYGVQAIPKLYVLDADGKIHFQLTGYSDDGLFGAKLRWMVSAVGAGASQRGALARPSH